MERKLQRLIQKLRLRSQAVEHSQSSLHQSLHLQATFRLKASENLYSIISPVCNNDISLLCNSNSFGSFKLPCLVPFASKSGQKRAVFVEHLNPMIVRVAHDDVIVSVRGDPGGPVEFAVAPSALSEFEQELTFRAEHLNAVVSEVSDNHVTLAIHRYA